MIYLDLGCGESNGSMAEQPLATYRANANQPYVATHIHSKVQARAGAKAARSLAKRSANKGVLARVAAAMRKILPAPLVQQTLARFCANNV